MIQRCNNHRTINYKNYGGRGIAVCDRWLKFSNFLEDMGARPGNRHTIERINNNKGYCPDNCKWATYTVQVRNRRVPTRNKSGVSGVGVVKSGNYRVRIGANYKTIIIGTFANIKEATEARKQAEVKYWGK